jgi:hypothetical protein
MRRLAACTTVFVLVTTTLTLATGVTTSFALGATVTPDSVWNLETAATCESDSFTTHRAFSSTFAAITGDAGTYRQGSRKIKMTWTAGAAAGVVFKGIWRASTGVYTGSVSYPAPPSSTAATLAPATAKVCPLVTTTPASASITLGDSDTDTATVTGTNGIVPAGTVSFYVCGPDHPAPCTAVGGTSLGAPIPLTKDSDSALATSPTFTPAAAGTYCFVGVYSGDPTYLGVSDGSTTDECFDVAEVAPGVTTSPTTASIPLGFPDSDTATITGQAGVAAPTGTVTFYVCGPEPTATATACTPPPPDSATAAGYRTPIGGPVTVQPASPTTGSATSASFTPTAAGTYCFVANYSGDGNFNPASDSSTTDECFDVIAPHPVVTTSSSGSDQLGASAFDTAVIIGANEITPTGTVSFYVCGPEPVGSCTTSTGTPVGGPVPVAPDGTGPSGEAMASATSGPFRAPATGAYCFLASYSGDGNYAATLDNRNDAECFTVGSDSTPVSSTRHGRHHADVRSERGGGVRSGRTRHLVGAT